MAIAILGGGWSGLAAASMLADQGLPVTVFEAGSVLGGRARRVTIENTALDNGLHVLLGAYTETLRQIRMVNPLANQHLLQQPLNWHIAPDVQLRLSEHRAPFNLLWGLLGAQGFSLSDKLAAAKWLYHLRKTAFRLPQDETVGTLLTRFNQPANLIAKLWAPLCLAALNTPIERASAQVFLQVLHDSLGADHQASNIILARTDLSALYPEPAAAYITARGGKIHCNQSVTHVTTTTQGYAVHLKDSVEQFSHVICAVSPHHAAKLMREIPALQGTVRQINALQYEPIHSIYLQFDSKVKLPTIMLGLDNSPAQWVFDRGYISGQDGLIGAVISASHAQRGILHDDLAQQICSDLRTHIGTLPALRWHQVIAEKRATFSCTPRLERPSSSTASKRFYLAGDYTAGIYPATLEGAVRSGILCAYAILDE